MKRARGLITLLAVLWPAAAMAQAPALVQQANATLDNIFQSIGKILTPERMKELVAEGSAKLPPEVQDQINRIEPEVVAPLVNAGLSCSDLPSAQLVILRVAAQYERTGPGSPPSIERAATQLDPMSKRCEEEAKAKCKAAQEPEILVKFWQQGTSWEARNSPATLRKRAKRICTPKSYAISGNAGPMKVSGTACSLEEPFTVSGGGGGMNVQFKYAPSGEAGGQVSYTGGGSGVTMAGAGSYTVTLTDKGGTLKQTHTGKVLITGGGSATHTDTLTLTKMEPPC